MQNEYAAWRRGGIGSKDARAIMGTTTQKTVFQLWQEKRGMVSDAPADWTDIREAQLGPIALKFYGKVRSLMAEHEQYPYMRASVHGFNPETSRAVHVKVASLKEHDAAMAGQIPEKYVPQVQHQLFVTGADQLDYVSIYCAEGRPFSEAETVVVAVRADIPYLRAYFAKAQAFWAMVLDNVAPPWTAQDFKPLRAKGLTDAARNYVHCQVQLRSAKTDFELASRALEARVGGEERVRVGELLFYMKDGRLRRYEVLPEDARGNG